MCFEKFEILLPDLFKKQKMFEHFGSAATELPVTDWLTNRVISFPIHTEMEDEQLNHICKSVGAFIESKR